MSKTSDMVAATKFMMNYNNSEKNKYTRILEKMDYIKKENKFLLKIAFSTNATFVNLNTTSPYLRRERRSYYRTLYFDELIRNMERLPFKIVTDNKYLFSVNVGVYDALLDITPTNKLKSLKGFPSKIKTLHIGKGCKYLESFGNDIEHINTLILQGGNFETFDGIPFTEKLIINNTILKEIKDFSMLTERVEFVHTGVVTYETEVFMKSIARKLS